MGKHKKIRDLKFAQSGYEIFNQFSTIFNQCSNLKCYQDMGPLPRPKSSASLYDSEPGELVKVNLVNLEAASVLSNFREISFLEKDIKKKQQVRTDVFFSVRKLFYFDIFRDFGNWQVNQTPTAAIASVD